MPSPEIVSFNLRFMHESYLTSYHPAREKALRRVELRMSGKYAFTKTLKELRFLHCQTSEHSNAVRYEGESYRKVIWQKDGLIKAVISDPSSLAPIQR
jgi:hypothetical protein